MTALLFSLVPVSSYAEIDTELNIMGRESGSDTKSQGCDVARKIASGKLSEGALSAEESLALSQIKRDHYKDYVKCVQTGEWELEYYGKPGSTAHPSPLSYTPPNQNSYAPYSGKVMQLADASTLVLTNAQRVRLIGIQVPEAKRAEARQFLNSKILNQEVRMEYDREEKDPSGRYLAYVYTSSRELINRSMIDQGIAVADPGVSSLRYGSRLVPRKRKTEV